MILESSIFTHNGPIPRDYTCQGKDLSPDLTWSQIPANTKSFALIVDDPDAPDPNAPTMVYVHWVLYNIPPNITKLPKGAGNDTKKLPSGIKVGTNDWDNQNYGGPCPPIGRHRYYFKLYALDAVLPDLHNPSKKKLEAAMKGHIIDKAELIGTYQKTS